MNDYVYSPLPSKSHIRLFNLEPDDHTFRISIRLRTWELADAPEYTAISYVWGDSQPIIPISISGYTVRVRENCYMNLHQLRQHSSSQYYWMDTLCINQNDIPEKNDQVAIMAEIYSQAQCVLAAVGMHESGSKFLVEELKVFEDIVPEQHRLEAFQLPTLRNSSWGSFECELSDTADRWYNSLDDDRHQSLLFLLHYFGYRPYWGRLWIVQELFKARGVLLLCGDCVFSWDSLHAMCRIFVASIRNPKRKPLPSPSIYDEPFATQLVAFSPMGEIMNGYTTHSLRINDYGKMNVHYARSASFCRVFHELHKQKCFEVRDKVFGLLSLGDWPSDLEKIKIDYNVPLLDLAIQVIPCFDPTLENFSLAQFASTVMEALGVSVTGPEIAGLLDLRKARFASATTPTQCPSEEELAVPRVLDTSWDVAHLSISLSGHPAELSISPAKVSVPKQFKRMGVRPPACTTEELMLLCKAQCVHDVKVLVTDDPSPTITGLACGSAQPGDVFLTIRSGGADMFSLVVRAGENGYFAVVGQAMLSRWVRTYRQSLIDTETFDTFFDAEDIMAMLAQGGFDRHVQSNSKVPKCKESSSKQLRSDESIVAGSNIPLWEREKAFFREHYRNVDRDISKLFSSPLAPLNRAVTRSDWSSYALRRLPERDKDSNTGETVDAAGWEQPGKTEEEITPSP